MKKFCFLVLSFGSLLTLWPSSLLSTASSVSTISFVSPQFESRWNYSDKAFLDFPGNISQSWTWGPNTYSLPGLTVSERYLDAPGESRKVQYFDKGRMELNSKALSGSLFEVTGGLLVKELVTGFRQDGDNTFTGLAPSVEAVAGDSNFFGQNQVSPVYASFSSLIYIGDGSTPAPDRTGQPIDQSLDRAGQVKPIAPGNTKVVNRLYVPATGHNIAGVFLDYFNLKGPIWQEGHYQTGSVFYNNPTYLFGLPVTEPYWVRAEVSGQEKDVLVQLFERRVLTYTTGNPDPFKVEMGNVGLHYYHWRYPQTNPLRGTVSITLAIDNQTLTLRVGETFILNLGEGYEWTVNIDDPTVVSRIPNILVIRGAQGIYQAHSTGQANLTASGEPSCRKTQPPCQAPSRLFRLTVVVK